MSIFAEEEVDFARTEINFHRPWLYDKQRDALYDPHRLSLIEASTKAGKTIGCIIWLVEQALAGGGDGRHYWWVAPVTVQAMIAFGRMIRYLPRGSFTANQTLKTIVMMNGSIIWFKGADRPDTLYGEDVHAAVIDEASRLKETAWEAVRTTLVATRGPIRIIGNVKGRKNWFYALARAAERARDRGLPSEMGYHRITAPDAVAAGVLASEEIESARNSMRAHAFRELFMAEPSDDEGNPFGVQHIRACIANGLSGGAPAVWGIDLAKRQDYTVCIALDAKGFVCRFERFQHIPWDDILKRIVAAVGTAPALVDSTGVGDPILDFLQKKPGTRFEGYHFNPASKQKLMEGLAVAIQSRAVYFPDGVIAKELEEFEYQYTRTAVRYAAPDGGFDDCVCALALAVMHKATAQMPMIISKEMVQQVMHARPARRRY